LPIGQVVSKRSANNIFPVENYWRAGTKCSCHLVSDLETTNVGIICATNCGWAINFQSEILVIVHAI
jgi:hypothetical protein